MKSVLIICYSFPPYPGIGGRRWAKFAKYLQKNGNKVYAICAENPYNYNSSWNNDVREIETHQLPIRYPLPLITFPTSISGRILYKISLLKVKLLSKGNYYDKTIFWEKQLKRKCADLIQKHNIKNVICSVGPFNMSQHVINLKQQFPDVNFILDYRDPWTNNKMAFGFMSISEKRLLYETQVERSVLEKYDLITGVSAQFNEHFEQITSNRKEFNKYYTLPNGYDNDDFSAINPFEIQGINSNEIMIVFAGTFYDKSIHVLKKLINEWNILNTAKQIENNLKFVFLGTMSQEGIDLIRSNDAFIWLGKRTLPETNYIVSRADYCSLFLTDDLDYSFSTKFYEYIAQNKKTLAFSRYYGYTSKYIDANKIGYGIYFDNMKEKLVHISKVGKPMPIDCRNFDASRFDISKLTIELEQLLK